MKNKNFLKELWWIGIVPLLFGLMAGVMDYFLLGGMIGSPITFDRWFNLLFFYIILSFTPTWKYMCCGGWWSYYGLRLLVVFVLFVGSEIATMELAYIFI